MFLCDIREDAIRRGSGSGEVYDEDGHLVARRSPPRWFELTYLVTAWASRPQDEHRLLSQVLATLVATDTLLTGTLAELGLTVGLDTAKTGFDAPAASDVWSAMGGELKASLSLRVRAPLAGITKAVAEIRRLLDTLLPHPRPELNQRQHALRWSHWRRRHQAIAQRRHYLKRAGSPRPGRVGRLRGGRSVDRKRSFFLGGVGHCLQRG